MSSTSDPTGRVIQDPSCREILPSPRWRRALRRVALDPFEIGITNLLYRLSHSDKPWIYRPLTRMMLRRFKIDMREALDSDPRGYARFSELFTRQLRPGLRPIDPRENAIVSSVDGCISQVGSIEKDGSIVEIREGSRAGARLLVKGIRYQLLDLLGGLEPVAARYLEGAYNNTYLAPYHYHRMHMPMEGRLLRIARVSGRLRSVSQVVQLDAPEPVMTTNERVILEFQGLGGHCFCLVFVGAVGVSGIATRWVDFRHPRDYWFRRKSEQRGLEIYEVEAGRLLDKGSVPKRVGRICEEACRGQDSFLLKKGDEVGIFEMGSTVVSLFSPEMGVKWLPNAVRGREVKMGEAVGECVMKSFSWPHES